MSVFPNVPNLPGVPQLARQAGASIGRALAVVLGLPAASDALWSAAQQSKPVWGVFDSAGAPVIDADSVVEFSNRNEWELATFPLQDGRFASYNKVKVPFEASVLLTKGGSQLDRQGFLSQIDAIVGDTNLYTIITPEKSYGNCNVRRSELLRRSAAGAFFLEIELFFVEAQQAGVQYTSATANAQDPTARPAVNQGSVAPLPIDQQTQAAASFLLD